jgi:hypothetical protein
MKSPIEIFLAWCHTAIVRKLRMADTPHVPTTSAAIIDTMSGWKKSTEYKILTFCNVDDILAVDLVDSVKVDSLRNDV